MSFQNKYCLGVKSFFDYSAAITLLIILSPLLLVISLLVYLNLGTPIIFKQQRAGKNGEIFFLYKFRSMKTLSPHNNCSDSERITPFGNFIRKTSLDELPQIINILQGKVSFVGPRPLLPEYLPLYSSEQHRRHHMRPGITGWAQINGRNSISWKEKFKLDVWYIDHWSLWLDVKVLFLTVSKVVMASGVNSGENITMEKFKGN